MGTPVLGKSATAGGALAGGGGGANTTAGARARGMGCDLWLKPRSDGSDGSLGHLRPTSRSSSFMANWRAATTACEAFPHPFHVGFIHFDGLFALLWRYTSQMRLTSQLSHPETWAEGLPTPAGPAHPGPRSAPEQPKPPSDASPRLLKLAQALAVATHDLQDAVSLQSNSYPKTRLAHSSHGHHSEATHAPGMGP